MHKLSLRRQLVTTSALALIGASAAALPAYAQSTDGAQKPNQQAAAQGSQSSGTQAGQKQDEQQLASGCGASWAYADTDDSGTLGREEVQEAIDAQFARLDLDDNGKVTLDEYMTCRFSVGATINEAKGDVTAPTIDFDAADADKSGDVSAQEAAAAAEKTYGQNGQDMSKEQHAKLSSRQFAQMDQDSDGLVTTKEWEFGLGPDFSELDTDENGLISREEFDQASPTQGSSGQTAEMQQSQDPASSAAADAAGSAPANAPDKFAMLDADKSGDLSKTEWQNHPFAVDVQRRFARVDTNSDGEVSKQEWSHRMTQAYETSQPQQQAQAQGQDQQGIPVTVWRFYYVL